MGGGADESSLNSASHYNLCQSPSILLSSPLNLVKSQLSFRVSVPPRRHLQINEKCQIWFHSSQTMAPQLCHKLFLLFWSLAGTSRHRHGQVQAIRFSLRVNSQTTTFPWCSWNTDSSCIVFSTYYFLFFSYSAVSCFWMAFEQRNLEQLKCEGEIKVRSESKSQCSL